MSKAYAAKNTMEDSIDVSYQLRFRSSLNSNSPLLPCQRKLFSSSSMRTLSQNDQSQIVALQKENENLKKTIQRLSIELKTKEALNDNIQNQLKEEIKKLKRVIEKSFYSIKNMEKEIETVQEQCDLMKIHQQKAQIIINGLQTEKMNLINSIQILKLNHKSQINLIWERVADLQKNLETIVELMERDKLEGKRFKKDCKDLTHSTIQRTECFSARVRSYQ